MPTQSVHLRPSAPRPLHGTHVTLSLMKPVMMRMPLHVRFYAQIRRTEVLDDEPPLENSLHNSCSNESLLSLHRMLISLSHFTSNSAEDPTCTVVMMSLIFSRINRGRADALLRLKALTTESTFSG